MRRIKMDGTLRWWLLATLLGSSTPLLAANLAFETSAGIGQSDNVGRQPVDEQEETIANIGLQFSLDERTRRLDADVVGNLGYYDYLDDTFESELLGNVAANVRVGLLADRVYWDLAENFGQVLIDPFTPATPTNLENINFFSTGPVAEFTLGAATLLSAGARYSRTTYEDRPFDSTGFLGEFGVGRALSSSTSLMLLARAQKQEYDEAALDGDYDQNEIFLRYDATGSRTRLMVELGHTELDQEAIEDSESAMLLRVDVSRRLSSRTMGTLAVGQEFSGSGSSFAEQQSGGQIGLDAVPGLQTIDPFTSRYAELGWNLSATRTSLQLSGSWRKELYESNPSQNQTITEFSAALHRDMSASLRASLDASLSSGSFELPGGDYDDLIARASLDWQLSRRLSLRFSYEHANRDSDLSEANYTENRLWLSLAFWQGEPRDSMLGAFERERNQDQDQE